MYSATLDAALHISCLHLILTPYVTVITGIVVFLRARWV